MSEISSTMSLQLQAVQPELSKGLKNDSGEKDENIIKSFADSKAFPDTASLEKSNNFISIENLINETMEKEVADENEKTVGGVLIGLTQKIQQEIRDKGSNFDPANSHPKVTLSSGFIIDLVSGTMTFDVSTLIKIKESEETTDEFIEALKSKKQENSIPTFKDIISEVGKVPTKLKLQKEIDAERQKNTADEIKSQSSKLKKTYVTDSLSDDIEKS